MDSFIPLWAWDIPPVKKVKGKKAKKDKEGKEKSSKSSGAETPEPKIREIVDGEE